MSQDLKRMYIECSYIEYNVFGYTCRVCQLEKQKIPSSEKLEFIGTHKNGKADRDVKFIEFSCCNIPKVPQGLTEKFPNLQGMEIWCSGLKRIKRNDLVEYKNFKWLFFANNKIKYLPGDLFADCKYLERISFNNNFLTTVEPNILDGLEHLNYLKLNGKNNKYGEIDSETTLTSTNPKLVELKINIYEKYVKRLKGDNKKASKTKRFIQADVKDFCVIIDNKQFPVHKIILTAQSPTIAEMLHNNPDAEYLNLVDISADIFEKILKFLYTDELPQETNFMQLFAAAKHLKILKLEEHAAEIILGQLNHEHAIEVLNLGNKYKHDEMKRKALEKIQQKYPEIEFKDEWLDDDEKIEKIVEYFLKMQEIEKEFVGSIN